MKQLFLAGLALSIVAFAPTGSQQCSQVHEQVVQPAQDILFYLDTQPTLEVLAGPGCLQILTGLNTLPEGAQHMRELGARGVENTHSRCTTTLNSIHYPCGPIPSGSPRCLPQTYTYCGQWAYSMTSQPKYELAMELSTEVEIAYDKAQQLCGSAMRWDETATQTATKDLRTYLADHVLPKSEKLYEMSCSE